MWLSDNSRRKTRVNIGSAFNSISGDQGFETDYEMAVFLLDRYVIFIVFLNNFEGRGFAIYVCLLQQLLDGNSLSSSYIIYNVAKK